MSATFSSAKQLFFTSESVTEGHPDKIADQISDAVLDAHLAQDPNARVACETVVKGGFAMLLGEIRSRAQVDYEAVAREVIRDIGYTDPALGFDCKNSSILVSLVQQSPDISGAIDHAVDFETSGPAGVETIGAGDQGMMTGFAADETPDLMPLPISLAHRITQRLAQVRKDGTLAYLRPDGKSQVTVEYSEGRPLRVDTILVLTQHDESVDEKQVHEDLRTHVIEAVIPADLLDDRTKVYSNTTGTFIVGGPVVDTGLTGRKLQVDTYGGAARHGGGAFSGKDATKVDRSGAYAGRYVAKNVVAAGLASRFELQVAYAVGMARPLSVSFETFGTHTVPEESILKAVNEVFDLRPGGIIQGLGLRQVKYRPVAAYGHFGRPDLDLPWERTDKAEALRQAVGLD
ncbi:MULTISPECIES: methionine adenosyltransferase [Streptacidiphilus]|uniref:S-adenosylmethionine synthase n=1 Tax=Streptacidiphilus cavernicola TaxID=3342716 RepID=A0ABV6UX64_9ACTN|nr:methionine adenosyltransferase [Streptacidiphilus jeojiense]